MTKEAAVQFYFPLTIAALVLLIVASLVAIIWASHRSSKKLTAHLTHLLSLPPSEAKIWVGSHIASDDYGEHLEYTLYAQVEGEASIELSTNPSSMKWACRALAAKGRPVKTAPREWLSEA